MDFDRDAIQGAHVREGLGYAYKFELRNGRVQPGPPTGRAPLRAGGTRPTLAVARYRIVVSGDQMTFDDSSGGYWLALCDVRIEFADRRRAVHSRINED